MIGNRLGPYEITAKLGGERHVVAVSDEGRVIESFGVSPVDGRIVVSAGWTDSDVMLAEGIAGIGASLPQRDPRFP